MVVLLVIWAYLEIPEFGRRLYCLGWSSGPASFMHAQRPDKYE
jgi:hypothetical protein